jgi:hypothetical protein
MKRSKYIGYALLPWPFLLLVLFYKHRNREEDFLTRLRLAQR